MEPVRWGVLGVSGFATRKSIPGMLKAQAARFLAIASRSLEKARHAADMLGIPRAYGSYEELLADPALEAVYIPLPNHLHVPWSIRAVEAGKHVLCEKPLALNQAEIVALIAARDRARVRVGEAFMVATHPQWLRARKLVRDGRIGTLRLVEGTFSYYNDNPANIRNIAASGGGALMDIGCYPIFTTRFVSGEEPRRALGLVERDPRFGTDRLTSALLDFPSFQALFSCGTQLAPRQRMTFVGSEGRIELEVPFNAQPDHDSQILVDRGGDLYGATLTRETLEACDQYGVEADAFSRAVRGAGEVPVPPEDSLHTMAVMEAITRSAASARWEDVAAVAPRD